jgi:hypothetical protein
MILTDAAGSMYKRLSTIYFSFSSASIFSILCRYQSVSMGIKLRALCGMKGNGPEQKKVATDHTS